MSKLDILALISVAFLNSFSHCYAMCGGFSLAFLSLNSRCKNLEILILVYHLFRILAYAFLGVFFGIFTEFLKLNFKIQSLVFFVLGIFMIILGFALIFRGKFLAFIENKSIFSFILQNILKKTKGLKGFKSAVLLGFLNGFVPCGLVYFFLASAVSKQSIFESIFVMLVFGISTLPAMLFFSKLSKFIKDSFKKAFAYVSYMLIIFYGLNLAYFGFKAFK